MGLDEKEFVNPERISKELFCPICTLVLENPVQTPSEHLFCEEELLEWMTTSDVCPITKENLNPGDIRKPGRIISNLLGELVRYCPNKEHGCEWTGENDNIKSHLKSCRFKSREQLLNELETKDEVINKLKKKNQKLSDRMNSYEQSQSYLKLEIQTLKRKLKVYDAFIREADGSINDSEIVYKERNESISINADSTFRSNNNDSNFCYENKNVSSSNHRNDNADMDMIDFENNLENSTCINSPDKRSTESHDTNTHPDLNDNHNGNGSHANSVVSDLERIARLRRLQSLVDKNDDRLREHLYTQSLSESQRLPNMMELWDDGDENDYISNINNNSHNNNYDSYEMRETEGENEHLMEEQSDKVNAFRDALIEESHIRSRSYNRK